MVNSDRYEYNWRLNVFLQILKLEKKIVFKRLPQTIWESRLYNIVLLHRKDR